jgi:hypothetical protein
MGPPISSSSLIGTDEFVFRKVPVLGAGRPHNSYRMEWRVLLVGDTGFEPVTSTVCKRHKKRGKRKL